MMHTFCSYFFDYHNALHVLSSVVVINRQMNQDF